MIYESISKTLIKLFYYINIFLHIYNLFIQKKFLLYIINYINDKIIMFEFFVKIYFKIIKFIIFYIKLN